MTRVAPAALRPRDIAAQRAPLDAAVEEYIMSRLVCTILFPVATAAILYLSYATWARYNAIGSDLTFRWMRISLLPMAGVWYFFYYAIVRVYPALRNIKEPGYQLFKWKTVDDVSNAARVNPRHFALGDVIALPVFVGATAEAEVTLVGDTLPVLPGSCPVVLRAKYSERLGNNVFQYVIARLRAMHLGVDFSAPMLGGPFRTVVTDVSSSQHPLTLHASRDSTEKCSVATGVLGADAFRLCWFSWLSQPTSGYVLNTEMLTGFEGYIGSWLRPSLAATAAKYFGRGAESRLPIGDWQPNDVAIHVRLGDILWGHHAAYRPLPCSFYREALGAIATRLSPGAYRMGTQSSSGTDSSRTVSTRTDSNTTDSDSSAPAGVQEHGDGSQCFSRLGRVVIVTEDKTHEIIVRLKAHLQGLGLEVLTQADTLDADFSTLYTAPNLIISISSFAWWAAYLGNATSVVMPDYGLLMRQTWHPRPDILAQHDLGIRSPAALPELLEVVGLTLKGLWEQLPGLSAQERDEISALLTVYLAQSGTNTRCSFAHKLPADLHESAATTAALGVFTLDDKTTNSTVSIKPPAGSNTSAARLRCAFDAIAEKVVVHSDALRAVVGRPSPRVVVLQQPHLRRWDGDFKHTMEALFD